MTIRFTCSCGQKLRVTDERAGTQGVCPRCGGEIVVPSPWKGADPIRIDKADVEGQMLGAPIMSPADTPSDRSEPNADVPESFPIGVMLANRRVAGKTCSICQTSIQLGEQVQVCESCSLPFHSSCWQENEGCGTYGCERASSGIAHSSDADLRLDGEHWTEDAPLMCAQCDHLNQASTAYCSSCGMALGAATAHPERPQPVTGSMGRRYAENKEPWVALILSLFIVGLGQFYNGDPKKGVLMMIGTMVTVAMFSVVPWFVIGIWSAIDAYQVAAGKEPLW